MSFEKLQLPGFLLAELYHNSIVELEVEDHFTSIQNHQPEKKDDLESSPLEGQSKIKYLGRNNKNVAVLLYEKNLPFISDDNLTFLIRMLKACNLDLQDIAIINMYTQNIDFDEVQHQLKIKNCLLFDVEPSSLKLPFGIPPFQVQQFNGCGFICAPALDILALESEPSRLLKSKLWMGLQKMFKLS